MRILYDGTAGIAYCQIYVTSDDVPDLTDAFAGQANGLCGAAEPGVLILQTGTHTGRVRFTVEMHDQPPPPADGWEEVVEVSFVPNGSPVGLVEWGESELVEIELEAPVYRVQYCASGMDLGRDPYGGIDPDTIEDDDASYLDHRPDRYLLRFWPDPAGQPRPDAVLRQTSKDAAHQHQWARGLPKPPTAEQRAETERREQEARLRRQAEFEARELARVWGGRPPTDQLRQVGGNILQIVQYDRDTADAVVDAGPATQRRIALWAARRAYQHAGIAQVPWLAPAWSALEHGEPLPAEYTDLATLRKQLMGERGAETHHTEVRFEPHYLPPMEPRELIARMLAVPLDPVSMALPALPAAAEPDPLRAALEAVWYAVTAHGSAADSFLADLRRSFSLG
ncbi:hypothetical protein BJY16_006738 [Actinoplanes octamycinicus]|uniref:Uncharacterized protein n=1 Tax=Actinoplanes octamycinicus TaxID=135948 RepID=A0A7W7H3S9_9ACTN|nr:hypothetical protein [Actinoplanes octamycinicus]MBB4743279.1 hypothetical protein [Actinoplanes octamycinicus]GIE61793.1 hypothetical protein Aoc01nite_71950 [Actinoplanes octamycinicus]